jgi:hypothetical protein
MLRMPNGKLAARVTRNVLECLFSGVKRTSAGLGEMPLMTADICPLAIMTVMPIMVAGHSLQLELGRGSNHVEPGLALDAYRLQSK